MTDLEKEIERLKSELAEINATVPRPILKAVLRLIQDDPHQWSSRPCSTCQTISGLIGEPFGCSLVKQR
jgi:hypothetical protein